MGYFMIGVFTGFFTACFLVIFAKILDAKYIDHSPCNKS